MLKTLAAVLLVSALTAGSAFAKDVSAGPDDGARHYVQAVKACLIEAKVPLEGENPGCYMAENYHLKCKKQYDEIAVRCHAAGNKQEGKRVAW